MQEQKSQTADRALIAPDRRQSADRRAAWRGGRRDSDWLERGPISGDAADPPAVAGWWRRLVERLGPSTN
jgi:hypothetical protein